MRTYFGSVSPPLRAALSHRESVYLRGSGDSEVHNPRLSLVLERSLGRTRRPAVTVPKSATFGIESPAPNEPPPRAQNRSPATGTSEGEVNP
jgi:hypothetical protein